MLLRRSDSRSFLINIVEQHLQVFCNSFIFFENNEWSTRHNKLNKISLNIYFETAWHIVNELNYCEEEPCVDIESALRYVTNFNAVWTSAALSQKRIVVARKLRTVQFSSHCSKFSWLSNMFSSIIVDFHQRRVLLHVEAGYVAFKVGHLSFDAKEVEELCDKSALIQRIVTMGDGKKVKQLGKQFQRLTTDDNDSALHEMRRLVMLKFEQNSVLKKLLITTAPATLEEHTSDDFWGTANGTCYEETSNQLGKILMEVRLILSSHNNDDNDTDSAKI